MSVFFCTLKNPIAIEDTTTFSIEPFIISNASIEDIEYHEDRRLDKNLILKLASSGSYIHDNHIILKGPTGSAKRTLKSVPFYARQ
ncbi:hypothetical protein SAMN05421807_1271 [Virgibacillus chiguensis]|uniref:Uncharacterized protein n=1 Tax=Virgibacillus chiguensis TaxID=411959 RepID=A0A1M5XH99_9BACI|nr:hypothetical protein SAMN05421807_1271 [Virgibacillus chiguensis]